MTNVPALSMLKNLLFTRKDIFVSKIQQQNRLIIRDGSKAFMEASRKFKFSLLKNLLLAVNKYFCQKNTKA